MRKFGFAFTLASAMVCGLGCSQGTVEKAEDATTAAGEAVESAAGDAADAVEGAADAAADAASDAADAVTGDGAE